MNNGVKIWWHRTDGTQGTEEDIAVVSSTPKPSQATNKVSDKQNTGRVIPVSQVWEELWSPVNPGLVMWQSFQPFVNRNLM